MGGSFGLLGLGQLYLNRTPFGLTLMIGWAIWLISSYTIINLLPRPAAVCFCLPLELGLQLIIPFMMALHLRKQALTSSKN